MSESSSSNRRRRCRREPQLLALRRLVIAEVGRFPKLRRRYDERGPGRTIEGLPARFRTPQQTADPANQGRGARRTAVDWLVLSIPINRAMCDARLRLTSTSNRLTRRRRNAAFKAGRGSAHG
jgi:TetR/AcrR family transcriptional regulator, mexJK operon transcriptional repressor